MWTNPPKVYEAISPKNETSPSPDEREPRRYQGRDGQNREFQRSQASDRMGSMRICRSVYRAGPSRPGPSTTSGWATISPECLPFLQSSRQVQLDRIVFGYVKHQRMMSCWQKQCSAIQHSFNEDRSTSNVPRRVDQIGKRPLERFQRMRVGQL